MDPGTVIGPNYTSKPTCLECLQPANGCVLAKKLVFSFSKGQQSCRVLTEMYHRVIKNCLKNDHLIKSS